MKKHIAILVFVILMMIPFAASADGENLVLAGWQNIEDNWYYYQDGEPLTGLQEITEDGVTNKYYFDDQGIRTSGLVSIKDSGLYYFSKSTGKALTGLRTIDGSKYYFSKTTCKSLTGLRKIDGYRYYFSKTTGKALAGLRTIDGSKYYFSKSSYKSLMGWRTVDGSKYYFSHKTGKALKGKYKIEGYYYYFSKTTAKRLTGWRTIDGKKYYFSKKNGRMFTGMHKISGNVYTFSAKGVRVRTVYKSKPAVCLTYDDGPSENTYTILNTLEKYNGLATFFVVGKRIDSYKGAVQKAHNMGCQIGDHTWSHPWLWEHSATYAKNQMTKCANKIKAVTGEYPAVCRTPGGDQTGYVLEAVGMPVILWNIDTRDWEHQNASKTYSAVMNHVSDGDIILMHDLYSATASASKKIIPALSKKGYQMVTIEEMRLLKGKTLKNGKVYYSF